MSSYTRRFARAIARRSTWRLVNQQSGIAKCCHCRRSWLAANTIDMHGPDCIVPQAEEWLGLFPEPPPPAPPDPDDCYDEYYD